MTNSNGPASGSAAWGAGYVTDTPYAAGYYRQQSPQHMAVGCLLGGVTSTLPRPDDPFTYLELGCGRGLGVLLLAAANPAWRVYAIDFSPAHIAEARALAAEARVSNIAYIEADLATFAETAAAAALPSIDACSMHGVWTWVGQPVRDGIVHLLADRLAPGGVVHVGYNALPGWQGALAMQRLVREAGLRSPGRSDRQVLAGLERMRALHDAGAVQLRAPLVTRMLQRLPELNADYLVHEYMNAGFQPVFHADLCESLAGAKLDWAGTCSFFDAFPELTLEGAQLDMFRDAQDPILAELIKDTCLERSLRHDVFVRGARRLGDRARDAALGDVVIALTAAPGKFEYAADFPVGRATLNRDFYGPVVARLSEGPCRVADLMAAAEGGTRNPAEILAMLVGTNQAAILTKPGCSPDGATDHVNTVLARRTIQIDRLMAPAFLVAPRMGAGLAVHGGELFVLSGLLAGIEGPDDPRWLAHVAALGGAPPTPEQQADLRALVSAVLSAHTPAWRAIGALA